MPGCVRSVKMRPRQASDHPLHLLSATLRAPTQGSRWLPSRTLSAKKAFVMTTLSRPSASAARNDGGCGRDHRGALRFDRGARSSRHARSELESEPCRADAGTRDPEEAGRLPFPRLVRQRGRGARQPQRVGNMSSISVWPAGETPIVHGHDEVPTGQDVRGGVREHVPRPRARGQLHRARLVRQRPHVRAVRRPVRPEHGRLRLRTDCEAIYDRKDGDRS
jgi:hypothetical protein